MTPDFADQDMDERSIQSLLSRVDADHQDTFKRLRIWRALINRTTSQGVTDADIGQVVPPPFHKSTLVLKAALADPMKAAQHYVSRISGNKPDIKVIPLSPHSTLAPTLDKRAGEQERLLGEVWDSLDGGELQNACAWGQTVGGVSYYRILPSDATFGLPDREYYPDNDQTRLMVEKGELSLANRVVRNGQLMYAEPGDVWAGRRKDIAKKRAMDGTSLFTLRAYPRDMVLRERDMTGPNGFRWIAFKEEISAQQVSPGTELARSAARRALIPKEFEDKFGLIYKDGAIIGGIGIGTPEGQQANGTLTLTTFFTRKEQFILVGGPSGQGGKLVYRGAHGCTWMGQASCPAVEVPFVRTDIETPGQEFATPLAEVMAYVPQITQMVTLLSNDVAINLIPRWYFKTETGTVLRGEDGEPVIKESELVPALDPSQAAVYPPGEWVQLKVDTAPSLELLAMYFERLDSAMPSAAATGEGGTSEAAWHAQLMIEQSHQNLQQPVSNHALAVKVLLQMVCGWLRQLDTPIYVYPMASFRSDRRPVRALVEFDPSDLTDSFVVNQEIHDPQATIIRMQIGMQQRAAGLIDDRKYYEEYAREKDPRQAEIDKYVQQVKDHVIGGVPAPPGSLIQIVSDAVRGRVSHQLLMASPNFAIASAEQMVAQAGMQGQPYAQQPGMEQQGQMPPEQTGGPASIAGVRAPGAGMAPTLQQQLGQGVPQGAAP